MPPEVDYTPELRFLAEQGDLQSQHQLGLVYWNGRGIQGNPDEGYRLLLAGAQHNYAPSQFVVGAILMGLGQGDQAVALILKAAEQGLAEGQYEMGNLYDSGRFVPRDIPLAIEWLEKAGAGGNGNALTNLGQMYWNGEGVSRDQKKAVRYWRKAAEMGFLHGQNDYSWSLATNYDAGQRNGKEAVKMALRAVSQRKDCATLDTLAAAYAENGEFEKAVDTQKKALESFKTMDAGTLAEWAILPNEGEMRLRLKMYQDGIPFREE